jgi:hypothetical protein
MASRSRDPRTKEELLDRMLSFDFDGDIRHLGVEQASLVRIAGNKLVLRFPHSGKEYELAVHIRREGSAADAAHRPGEPRSFAGEQAETEEQWQAAPEPVKKKGIRPAPRSEPRAHR